ncbi:MAG: ATP-binding cassette domain-containing protein [Cyclobacteriaceae bacterium]|nr:ATP-binding cassette domain-containing protein [Cyclobacteriaceae bacterium]
MIALQNIAKKLGNKIVLESISFDLYSNEIVGLIGPNGSGKTTLLNLIMGLLSPDSGTISHNGSIGAAVSRKGFFEGMTVIDNLKVFAQLKGQDYSEIKRVLDLFAIEYANSRFDKLSAGMKQRVALAQAFMGNHKLILLDEPTNHLDIDSIFILRSAIEARKQQGTAFILTSHVLTELEKLCNRVLFLINGKVRKEISSSEAEFTRLEAEYLKLSAR